MMVTFTFRPLDVNGKRTIDHSSSRLEHVSCVSEPYPWAILTVTNSCVAKAPKRRLFFFKLIPFRPHPQVSPLAKD